MRARWAAIVAAALGAWVAGAGVGCAGGGVQSVQPGGGAAGPARPLPGYREVAREYNRRIEPLKSLFASHVVRLTYLDEEGEKQVDQGEGTIQAVFPDRLALSIGKAGKRVFWLGTDGERYWWFDLRDARMATIGRLENFGAARRRIGLTVHPLDIVGVLGVLPLPEDAAGATQWSDDGTLLGVTTRMRDNGYQRLWLDPASYEPRKIELYDAGRELVLVADLTEYGPVEVADLAAGPRIARRVNAFEPRGGGELRLTMDAPEDGARRIKPVAFDFAALRETLAVERVVDLDVEGAGRVGGPGAGGAGGGH